MFDWKIIAYGLLTLCAIVASIITLTSKKQVSYLEWFSEVEKLFCKNGYSIGYVEQLNQRQWEDWYAQKLTPEDAFLEYFEQ